MRVVSRRAGGAAAREPSAPTCDNTAVTLPQAASGKVHTAFDLLARAVLGKSSAVVFARSKIPS